MLPHCPFKGRTGQGAHTNLRASTCWGLPQVGPWVLGTGLSSCNFRKHCLGCREAAKLDIHYTPWSSWQQVRSPLTSRSRRAQNQWWDPHQRHTKEGDAQAASQSSLPPGTSSFLHSWKEEKSVSQAAVLGVPSRWQALGWFRLGVVHIVLKTWWTHTFSSPVCLEWGQTAQRGTGAGFSLSLIINFSSRI